MKRSAHHLLAAVLAGLFGLFLTYQSLTSSDFPRGLYSVPPLNGTYWNDLGQLGANRVWGGWPGGGLQAYLNWISNYGIKAIIDISQAPYDTFYMEYYSNAQHHVYQAEWDYSNSWDQIMNHDRPEYFYYFYYGPDADSSNWRGGLDSLPPGGASWKCTQAEDDSGTMLWGPNETLRPYGNAHRGTHGNQDRSPDNVADSSFLSIVRVMANLSQLASLSDTVFKWKIGKAGDGNWLTLDSAYYTGASFAGVSSPNWKQFQREYVIPDGAFYVYYQIDWMDNCDFWVDYIEFYDMRRGRYLFEKDANGAYVYRNSSLTLIANQCQSIENTPAMFEKLAGWKQSDEPSRSMFDAHGVINLMARDSLVLPLLTPFNQLTDIVWHLRRPELFILVGKPPVLDIDVYPYNEPDTSGTHFLGSQVELDTLAARLERSYQAAADSSIPFQFTGQVHQLTSANLRHPHGSEILAESYMALAHGAKGLSFYPYITATSKGLVDSSYLHPAGTIYDEKWLAVQDVFTQLDAIGDTLLDLVRDTAFCVYPSNSGFKLPITNVYFTDDSLSQNYIEIGQFHLPPSISPDYLIIVNRRTNADRHISVFTDKTSCYALRDLYTQERFISTTGDFQGIPFDSGEGRVFKLEPFSASQWNNELKIVLADMLVPPGSQGWTTIEDSTTVFATAAGMLWLAGTITLNCNGALGDSVVFTALEANHPWQGIQFFNSIYVDTLSYTVVENAEPSAIRMFNEAEVYISHSRIGPSNGPGIYCDESDLTLESSSITNCASYGLLLINSKADIYNDSICYNGINSHAGIFAVSESVPKIGDTHLSHNDQRGITCMNSGTNAIMLRSSGYPRCGRNTIVENSYLGVFASAFGSPYMGLDSDRPGLNSIYDNGTYDVYNSTQTVIWAQYNWWGQNPQFYGWVDTSNALSGPPGDSFMGGSSLPPLNPSRGSDGLSPGGSNLSEANRLNNVAVELFLDGEYYTAIDTFALVVNNFPGTSPARFALNHLVVCYREADDYEGAVAYLDSFLQPPTDPTLVPLALYHKVLNLARLQEYAPAIAIAGNAQLMGTMPQDLQEPLMIELGMMQKYGMQNVVVGNGVFQQFLQQFPESPLAPIAAMELGIEWEPRGTSGSGAQGGITAVELPTEFRLHPNHPNPFNPATAISFQLPTDSHVSLRVYDLAGRMVAELVNGMREAGVHQVTWEASGLPSGLYFCRIQAGSFSEVTKLMLLK